MLRIEPRKEPSVLMVYATPFIALVLTILSGLLLFALLGKDPFKATFLIFLEPMLSVYSLSELTVKATPLILIGVGLSLGFRAGVWNIGAEGQFTVGALSGGAVALALYNVEGIWVLPLVCLAGALGGMAWAAIPAFLRTRLNTNEILVSLMLVYVATLLLSHLVHGVLRDPEGQNFPESRLFHDAALLPIMIDETRAHIGFLVALVAVAVAWLVLRSHVLGFQIKVVGQAPRAARFAGFSSNRLVWICFYDLRRVGRPCRHLRSNRSGRPARLLLCRLAMVLRPLSSPFLAGCTHSACCSRAYCWPSPTLAAKVPRSR